MGAGYAPVAFWLIMAVLLVMIFFWRVTKGRSAFWSASALLLVYIFLAILGVTVGLSLTLMVVGCIAALACWDLTHFDQAVAGGTPPGITVQLEKDRLRSLLVVSGASLLLVIISGYINLKFPFGVMVLLVLTAVGSLLYVVRLISRKNQ